MDLPAKIDLAALPPIVTSPTYTEILAATLGISGTGADGFNLKLADLADRAQAFQADVHSADPDLTPVNQYAGLPDPTKGDQLAADAPATTAALEDSLNVIDALVLGQVQNPSAGSDTSHQPGLQNSPSTFQASDFPVPTPGGIITAASPLEGDPPSPDTIGPANATHSPYYVSGVELSHHDPAIFTQAQVFAQQFAGTFTGDLVTVTITPARAGKYIAVVTVHFAPPGLEDFVYGLGVVVRSK